MAKYDAQIDLANRNISHTQIVELVGPNQRVLDVGCASGYLARVLAERGCRVSGLDNDAELAEPARDILEKLVIADLEETALTDHFDKGSFDVLVFGDVLEHVRDPEQVLRDSLSLLADGGRVVVSLPNVTHGSVRLALLDGRWRYTSTGLLDSTHVRFFDRENMIHLFRSVGLAIDVLRGTMADPLRTEVEVRPEELPPGFIEWVREQPDAHVYQFIVSAHPVGPDDTGEIPDLVPAAPIDTVRVEDEFSLRYREELETLQHVRNVADIGTARVAELRHELLTVRDHILGLEAEAASSRQRAAQAKHQLEVAQRRLEQRTKKLATSRRRLRAARRKLRDAERAEREVRTSRSWRVGRALTSPARIFRRGA